MHCPFLTPPRALLSSGYLNGDEVEWAVTQRRKHLPSGIHLFISLLKVYRHPCSIVKGTNHHFSSWQRIQGECKPENVNHLLLRGSQHEQETIHSSSLLEAVANLRAKAPQTQPPSSWVACICLWTKCRMLEGEAKTNSTSKNSLIIYLEPMPWLRYEPGIRAFVEPAKKYHDWKELLTHLLHSFISLSLGSLSQRSKNKSTIILVTTFHEKWSAMFF